MNTPTVEQLQQAKQLILAGEIDFAKGILYSADMSPLDFRKFVESCTVAESAQTALAVEPEPVAPKSTLVQPDADGKFPTPLDGALFMASLGIPQTPLRPKTKRPFLPAWQESATTDAAHIRKWAEMYPGCNFGSVAKTGKHFVFEADTTDVRKRFETTGQKFTSELIVASRPDNSRGHRWYLYADGVKNISQTYTKHGDFSLRADDEQCVSPGSIHPETGEQYRLVSAGAPEVPSAAEVAFWESERVEKSKDDGKKEAPRNQSGLVPHGAIHGYLLTEAGRLRGMGLGEESIRTALRELVEKNCQPPIDWDKVDTMAKSICNFPEGENKTVVLNQEQAEAAAQQATALTFRHPAIKGTHRDYVVEPKMGQKDGWFPLGSVSLIGGSSGSNKTTWALDLLHAQARKQSVWGHNTCGRPYTVFMFDRGAGAHKRTMERLGYALDEIPVRFLPPVTDGAAVTAILDHLESEPAMPQVVFIEGADMLVEDANKGQFVSPFMSRLGRIAEHYHIAIILSVGAPKMRVGEGYTAKRDSMLGSEKWSRMSETVVAMQFVDGDDTDCRRSVFVLLRNGAAERFNLMLESGKLVLDETPRTESNSFTRAKDKVEEGKHFYTRLFSTAGLVDGGKAVPLNDHRRALRGLDIPERAMQRAREFLSIYYDRNKQAYIQLEVSTADSPNTVTLAGDASDVPVEGTSATLTANVQAAEKMFSEGKSVRDVAAALGVKKSTVGKWKQQWMSCVVG
jgi:hypothetical protein